jgi:hypothetical protein
MYKNLLIIFLLFSFATAASAQTSGPDTTKTKKDIQNLKQDSVKSKRFVPKVKKEKVYHPDSTHSPHLAVIRSLMIPGWGQIYNHQWWKVPIIYAGLGLLADAIIYNQRNYAPNLIVARYYEHAITPTPNDPQYKLWATYQQYGVQAQTVYDIVDGYDRDRDLSIFGFLGAWGVQAVDAYIDAKFQHSYTMDTNFAFKVEPMFNQPVYAQNLNGAFISGIKVTIRF